MLVVHTEAITPFSHTCLVIYLFLSHFRCKNRLPLVEAMYNGHHRIIDVFRRKSIPMIHASRSWAQPLPMIPFMAPPPPPPKNVQNAFLALLPAGGAVVALNERVDSEMSVRSNDTGQSAVDQDDQDGIVPLKEYPKIGGPDAIVDMLAACLKGHKERACDDFVPRRGWVAHTDEDSNWSIALKKAIKAWDDICHVRHVSLHSPFDVDFMFL